MSAGNGPAPDLGQVQKLTKQLVDSIREHLTTANHYWPRSAFSHAEGQAVYLERRLTRCIGAADVEHCFATVGENEDRSIDYAAVILTSEAVIFGSLRAEAERGAQRIAEGSVHMVPRSAIRSLTLHDVEYFGYEDVQGKDYVSFTANFEDGQRVHVPLPGKGVANDGRTGRMFDSLAADLVPRGKS